MPQKKGRVNQKKAKGKNNKVFLPVLKYQKNNKFKSYVIDNGYLYKNINQVATAMYTHMSLLFLLKKNE
jgi:hypothetical protein